MLSRPGLINPTIVAQEQEECVMSTVAQAKPRMNHPEQNDISSLLGSWEILRFWMWSQLEQNSREFQTERGATALTKTLFLSTVNMAYIYCRKYKNMLNYK